MRYQLSVNIQIVFTCRHAECWDINGDVQNSKECQGEHGWYCAQQCFPICFLEVCRECC